MFGTKLLTQSKTVLLTLALVTVMAVTSQAEPRPSAQDKAVDSQNNAGQLSLADSNTGRDAMQLAMNAVGEEDRKELQELLAVLDEETEVATKTKMNNDFVPGMVTVLHGEQLEALGVQTVGEAMAMVPGIQASRLPTGEPTVKVRGFAFPFNAGNIKVMLNSIALSRESSGISSSVLLIPLAQVDRIEVIRGPGSSIYGDFALAGVVNIITKDNGGRLFGRAGDDGSRGGGGHYSYRDDAHAFRLGVNVSSMDDGESAAQIGRNPDEERNTGVFNLKYKNFSFTAEGVRRTLETQARAPFGGPPPPPPAPTGPQRFFRKEESWALKGKQTIALGSNAVLDAYLSYLQNSFKSDQASTEFRGDRMETGIDLTWSPWVGHQVLLDMLYADSDIDNATQENSTQTGIYGATGINRRNYSLGLQDQVTWNDQFSTTLGFRYDDYNDVGSLYTPRIAAVYRPGEHHIVKAQYSRGFRAPTFWELYGTGQADESLDFEVIATTELSYIYRRSKSVGRATLYFSEIDDGIYGQPGGGFGNFVDIDSKGVEVEWEQRLGDTFRWQANLSYNDTWDGRSSAAGHESPGIAAWLGNLAFFWRPAAKFMLTGRLLHVGDRYTADGLAAGYDTIDLTVSRTDLWKPGLTLRFGVKNLLDDKIFYLTDMPANLLQEPYRGRTWWMQLSYDF